WRTVPTDSRTLGDSARESMPYIRQIFIAKNPEINNELEFERKLYLIRKRAENAIRYSGMAGGAGFYMASLSSRTMVYKGMLTPEQVETFYPELADAEFDSALALVHSRFSTNTFPSWERAHPNRYMIHNGEINTLRGNINWMYARESTFQSSYFGEELAKVFPVIQSDGSDSSMFDECLEFLYLNGRSLPHAMMMMIPEPWSKHQEMDDAKKAFYEFHSCLMEPWDGPAAMAFSDGTIVGAALDRNGLRPARYYVTKDGLVILASEVGVIEVEPDRILEKGRLQPGRMLLIDTEKGRIVTDRELKETLAKEHPYREWLNQYLLNLKDLDAVVAVPELNPETLQTRQKAFGYTNEELRLIIKPMAQDGVEPIGSMGTDIPLAVLSEQPQLLYNYFKQLFAQVTNPPIDAIREEVVTGTELFLGSEGDLINPQPKSCQQLKLENPVLSNEQLAQIAALNRKGFKATTLPILFTATPDGSGLKQAMDSLCREALKQIENGVNIIILSDRNINENQVAIPALLAVAGLHHFLIREKVRTRVSLVLESGEPREVHHFALLIGYGATAVNPYLVFETIEEMVEKNLLADMDVYHATKNYRKAVLKGIVKILSKMGISTIQSYQGAQIFEALGIDASVIGPYFTGTPSRIGGVNLELIAQEALQRHEKAFNRYIADPGLETGGIYQWRKEGEYHLYNPETIHKLQQACWNNDYELYKEYTRLIDDQTQRQCTLRGLLEFKSNGSPVPLDEVESVESICRRFKTGAMSYGSISQEAHECLAIAMNRIGGKSNTGEGGEDPVRFKPDANGDSRCSAIKQVASGRFGVTIEYLTNAKEIQIKIAQGAKPGEGGQ
ncbi:MAG TPA: glutamate synthase central domain-containing protein, partial [Bacillota bacterium]|nr:glutamate synthase central domain-containing protein [Bacillota bacterium]